MKIELPRTPIGWITAIAMLFVVFVVFGNAFSTVSHLQGTDRPPLTEKQQLLLRRQKQAEEQLRYTCQSNPELLKQPICEDYR